MLIGRPEDEQAAIADPGELPRDRRRRRRQQARRGAVPGEAQRRLLADADRRVLLLGDRPLLPPVLEHVLGEPVHELVALQQPEGRQADHSSGSTSPTTAKRESMSQRGAGADHRGRAVGVAVRARLLRPGRRQPRRTSRSGPTRTRGFYREPAGLSTMSDDGPRTASARRASAAVLALRAAPARARAADAAGSSRSSSSHHEHPARQSGARSASAPLASPEALAAEEQRMGLDRPLPERYWTSSPAPSQGDFGRSFKTERPVATDLADRLPATLELALLATLPGAAWSASRSASSPRSSATRSIDHVGAQRSRRSRRRCRSSGSA